MVVLTDARADTSPTETRLHTTRRAGQRLGATFGTAALLLLTACASDPQQAAQTQTQPPEQVKPEFAPPPPPLPPPIREVQPKTRSKVTVIDPGDSGDEPKTLIEASRLAKARKRAGIEPPVHEITDENLKEFAEGAEIIMLDGEPAATLPSAEEQRASDVAAANDIQGEEYWQNRALELRMAWRRAIDELNELSLESAALRQQFYAEDDPYIRDTQIKPNWDRTLDRIEALKEQSRRYEQELDDFMDEGRQAGALQSWLNNGWELEPSSTEIDRFAVGATEMNPNADPPDVDPGVDITADDGG